MKFSFTDDYSELAHPAVVSALEKIEKEQNTGYGLDKYCEQAANLIRKEIKNENADVHFVSGGTQANIVALSSMLRSYEAVITAKTAHIEVHEAGAIEATGHKIIALEANEGKISAEQIQKMLTEHIDEHMVKPKVVSITQATEEGTVYKRAELYAIAEICQKNDLYLYIDGARLGAGVMCEAADADIEDIAKCADIFYIGGTKNGAIFGEAIVIGCDELKADFRFGMKQKGALLAKGYSIGAQFVALFGNGLYFELAKHANEMSKLLADGIKDKGYEFNAVPATNQIYPILPKDVIEELEKQYQFYVWAEHNETSSVVRLVTSWSTPKEKVEEFLSDLPKNR